MSNVSKGLFSAKNIAMLGVLTAFVILFQAGLGTIKIGPTSFSLVLIPIVLGSCLIGPLAGGFLGFVFSLIVFLYGLFGADVFTNVMLNTNFIVTFLIIFAKGILAGIVPGLLFNALKGVNDKLAISVAALSAPIVNTTIFVLILFAFKGTFVQAFIDNGYVSDATAWAYFVFIGCAGINFLVEFGINLVATPLFYTVINVVGKKITKGN